MKIRKNLSASSLYEKLYKGFAEVEDPRRGKPEIAIEDILMSGFAMFSLKSPSLLAFDSRRKEPENLHKIYGIGRIPCDTTMRSVLDQVKPESLRKGFKDIFGVLQRGKGLEPYLYMDKYYILSVDGTGHFASNKIGCKHCMEKRLRNGEIQYHHQMLGASIVHPDLKTVIPLMPEAIIRQDGNTKNDCERNATKRLLSHVRQDHPKLKFLVVQDALAANGPNIKELKKHKMRFVIGVKPGDHTYLFDQVEKKKTDGQSKTFEITEEGITHRFHFVNQVPLNASNTDILVNFLEYWEITDKGTRHFTWITDIAITHNNSYQLMRAGRARWKIENETFNTLKNQGYHLEHNFGHGKEHLSVVFSLLMMLAFLVDQVLEATCQLFQAALKKVGARTRFWEKVRSYFTSLEFESMEMLYKAIVYGYQLEGFIILEDTR